MIKRGLGFILIFIFLITFISAGWLGDLFGKITGNAVSGGECVFENPKDFAGNYILVSDFYYGENYTQYAERYCQIVQGCASFEPSSVIVKDDAVKACRCDDFWGCPYGGSAGRPPSCVNDVSQSSYWERVGSVKCTGCPEGTCEKDEKYCGDGMCIPFETCETCPQDCGKCPVEKKPICGNEIVEEGEECDGNNLNEQTCISRGFDSGTLSCSSTCNFNITKCKLESGTCTFVDPKDTEGNYILVSDFYYGTDYTQYAGTYCKKIWGCTGFKDVVVKDDAVKACRCDDFWGCPYGGSAGKPPSCVDVASSSGWERVGSVTCTGCPPKVCGPTCTDSDGGLNYYVKGNATNMKDSRFDTFTDQCLKENRQPLPGQENILHEAYCADDGYGYWNTYNCPSGCKDGVCIINLSISVATLKDNYLVGEQINLTDPPEEDGQIVGFNDKEFAMTEDGKIVTRSVYQNYFSDENIPKTEFIDSLKKEFDLEKEFDGYIVQFEKEPIIIEKKRLDEIAMENERYVQERAVYNPVRVYKQVFSIMPEDVDRKVRDYSGRLESENEKIKGRITDLERRGKITGNAVSEDGSVEIGKEFNNAFNGIYLNMSSKDAEEIKKVRGVKNIYPNYKVNMTLTDSVPLINADDVWKLDENGNDCSVSGKDCLTGKGVTIAIIDTGVDYTHGDLGGGDIELPERDFEKITDVPMDLFSNFEVDQQVRVENNHIVYYSGNKIYVYSFETKETLEIKAFTEDLEIIRLAFKDNLLAYFAADSELNASVYFYNLDAGEHKRISFEKIDDIGFIDISNGKVIYGKGSWINNEYLSNIYVYDTLNKKTITIAKDSEGIYTPIVSNNLVAYSVSSGHCYDKIVLYNLDTEKETEVAPPNVGPVLDFEGNELLYVDCSKTNFDRQWRHYHLYNINTGESISLFPDFFGIGEGSDINSIGFLMTSGWINKGAIGEEVVFFSKDVNANRIIAYDEDLDRYVQINPYKLSGVIDAEGKNVCFISDDLHLYCHDYDVLNNYPVLDFLFTDKVIGGYDFVNNDADPMDDHGHGTHCAATAAGNGILKGVAPDAKLYAFKVLDTYGSGYSDDIISAIESSIDLDGDGNIMEDEDDYVDVISMSLGGWGDPDDPMSQAVDNVVDAGVVAVIAAGNSGPQEGTIGSPGTSRKAITVGASNKDDKIASFSSRGPVVWTDENGDEKAIIKPDITAPGVDICAAQWDNAWQDRECLDTEHTSISGTSMATPHVAGAVALLKQKNPDWSPDEIKNSLKATAVEIGDVFEKNVFTQGSGRVDVLEAVGLDEKPLIANLNEMDYNPLGKIDILGTAKGDNFQNYSVYYTRKYDNNWNLICEGFKEIENGILCQGFDTNILSDYQYEVKLVVYGNEENLNKDYGVFEVDNVELVSPGISGEYNLDDFYESYAYYDYLGIFYPNFEEALTNTYIQENSIEVFGNFPNIPGISYTIEYSNADGESWFNNGIILTGKKGENVKLADWTDISSLSSGNYLLRLIIQNSNDGTTSVGGENKLVVVRDLHAGWPKDGLNRLDGLIDEGGIFVLPRSPDMEEWGVSGVGQEHLGIRDSNGNFLEGWPQEIDYNPTLSSVADLSNGGNQEIIIGYTNEGYDEKIGLPISTGSRISVFDLNGALKNGWPIDLGNFTSNYIAASDLDNDGNKEIIVSARYGTSCEEISSGDSNSLWCGPDTAIYVFDSEGNILPAWPRIIPRCFVNQIAIGDLNNDGIKEIVVFGQGKKTMWNSGVPDEYFLNTSALYIFNIDGTNFGNWPKNLSEFDPNFEFTEENKDWGLFSSGPVLADLDNDSVLEIIFAIDDKIYAFNSDGSFVSGWPRQSDEGWVLGGSPIAIGEIDNSSSGPEIVISSAKRRLNSDSTWDDLANGTKLFIFHSDGTYANNWPKIICSSDGGWVNYPSITAPIIADIDNDGENEIISPCIRYGDKNMIFAFNKDSSFVSGWPKIATIGFRLGSNFHLGDINQDGLFDLGFSSSSTCGYFSTLESFCYNVNYLFNLNVPYNKSLIEWEVYGNKQHTGCYNCEESFIPQRPQSKIMNNENLEINGTLIMKLQKKAGNEFIDEKIVTNQSVVIPANGLIKLDIGKDYGWNLKNVLADEKGDYRVYAGFEVNETKIESTWEFNVG